MMNAEQITNREAALLAEIERLRQEVADLKQTNSDLEIALLTTIEHGDLIEAELHESNQKLQAEIGERQLAQATLQEILETVSQDKADLEIMLLTTREHGDAVEYQLYTQAVETMRQSEELFRAISESTSILMILTQQQNGMISYANTASSEMLKIDVQTLIGTKVQAFFANPYDEQKINDLLSAQGHVRDYEMQVKRQDGSLFWVSASVHPLRLAGVSSLLITLYDISDRKDAESALRQSQEKLQKQAQQLEHIVEQRTQELRLSEEKYRSIFENAIEGIFQMSGDGRYLNANPALAKMYGYESPAELIASVKHIGKQLYVQPQRWEELLAYLKGLDSLSGFESQVYRKDGSTIWISEDVRAISDRNGSLHYEGSVRDITDRKAAEAELRQQRLLSERLLLNVLPQLIAERLKRGEKTIAENFTEVTVLFADIANFTQLSSEISPKELVKLLNDIFSAFDLLADQHGVEKIKTIGDAYMVVGGLPKPRPDHVVAIADMALDMQQEILQFRTPDNQPIALRIGIHTGAVVAGVIGRRKPIYDLWGDTVNVASRMESHGEPGQIQVSQTVYEHLKKNYRFQERGTISIKGKGLMNTYWLLAHKKPSGFRSTPVTNE
ncbi:adenylate/guanylate cyclase domain-containing protein [Aerosakkonema sp. BLCC-F2]|uniref:adenylate/guanylate cyclase domain-containing protein n=1 Tax=Aerosakkonema sp. BLCC-F183 TaxID=3342834 RepID=UPI0035B925B6